MTAALARFARPAFACLAFSTLFWPLGANPLRWETTVVSIDAPPLAESVEASFPFTNTGAQPVTIDQVHSSCGCTIATLEKRTYAPGETGSIRAVFNLGERVGLQEKVIMVTTAEPAASQATLTFRVQIPKLFEVSPYFVIWNGGETPTPKTINLRLLSPDLLSLAGVESRHAAFAADVKPIEGTPGHYTVTVTPTATDTPVNGAILVQLRAPDGKAHAVTLYALVRTASAPLSSAKPQTR